MCSVCCAKNAGQGNCTHSSVLKNVSMSKKTKRWIFTDLYNKVSDVCMSLSTAMVSRTTSTAVALAVKCAILIIPLHLGHCFPLCLFFPLYRLSLSHKKLIFSSHNYVTEILFKEEQRREKRGGLRQAKVSIPLTQVLEGLWAPQSEANRGNFTDKMTMSDLLLPQQKLLFGFYTRKGKLNTDAQHSN